MAKAGIYYKNHVDKIRKNSELLRERIDYEKSVYEAKHKILEDEMNKCVKFAEISDENTEIDKLILHSVNSGVIVNEIKFKK